MATDGAIKSEEAFPGIYFQCTNAGPLRTVATRATLVKRVRLGSAAIAAVTYDEKKQTLKVEFREGESYRYFHVPEFVYRELLKAESAGAFWNSVKDQYQYEKLD